ncbi:hypothetical protein BKA62DRAFT_217084 [Auriculariales sp. MPI-PUGE-AT-0066]|nr:hypothetical protein BKA62DRAFT_217084 [Auriculariales sp. MPI-PUGE-AT-0066]
MRSRGRRALQEPQEEASLLSNAAPPEENTSFTEESLALAYVANDSNPLLYQEGDSMRAESPKRVTSTSHLSPDTTESDQSPSTVWGLFSLVEEMRRPGYAHRYRRALAEAYPTPQSLIPQYMGLPYAAPFHLPLQSTEETGHIYAIPYSVLPFASQTPALTNGDCQLEDQAGSQNPSAPYPLQSSSILSSSPDSSGSSHPNTKHVIPESATAAFSTQTVDPNSRCILLKAPGFVLRGPKPRSQDNTSSPMHGVKRPRSQSPTSSSSANSGSATWNSDALSRQSSKTSSQSADLISSRSRKRPALEHASGSDDGDGHDRAINSGQLSEQQSVSPQHGKTQYVCIDCEKSYSRIDGLRKHQIILGHLTGYNRPRARKKPSAKPSLATSLRTRTTEMRQAAKYAVANAKLVAEDEDLT